MSVLYGAKAGAQSASDLYVVNPADASVVSLGSMGIAVCGMAYDYTTATMFASTSEASGGGATKRSIYTVDLATAAATLIGGTGLTNQVSDLAVDAAGNLYGFSHTTKYFCSIDKATGVATQITGSGSPTVGEGIDFGPDAALYGSMTSDALYTINVGTGNWTHFYDIDKIDQGGPDETFFYDIPSASFTRDGLLWIVGNLGTFDPVNDAGFSVPCYLATVNVVPPVVLPGPELQITTIGQLPDQFSALAWVISSARPHPPRPLPGHMTETDSSSLAVRPGGAGRQGPIWVVVRSTVHRPGLPRNHVATVDITDPDIQHELRASWIVPLPAAEQPGGLFDGGS